MAIYQDRIMRLAKQFKPAEEQINVSHKSSGIVAPKPLTENSIDGFKSLLSKGSGMARAAKYQVILSPPAGMVKRLQQQGVDITSHTRDISMLCDTIAMPGKDLQTHSAKYGQQLPTMMVDGHGFEGTITTTFYIDEDFDTKSYFELWQQAAVDPLTNKISYYKDESGLPNYAGSMKIFQLGGEGRTAGMKVYEVYPETIGQIEYAYATVDTLALLPIEFQYRRWGTISPDDLLTQNITLSGGIPMSTEEIARTEKLFNKFDR
jgi:hypothetical protein